MLPSYPVLVLNAENQCFMQNVGALEPIQVESNDPYAMLIHQLNIHSDIIVSVSDRSLITNEVVATVDHLLYVVCLPAQQRVRLIARGNYTDQNQVEAIDHYLANQLLTCPEATHVIHNTGTAQELSDLLIQYVDQYKLRLDTINT